MEVAIIFDPAFSGEAKRAVWLIDTPANRDWLQRQTGLDAGSAVFATERYGTMEAAVTQMIWNAQDHHPDWSAIEVIGAGLTNQIRTDLAGEGDLTGGREGFRLLRA